GASGAARSPFTLYRSSSSRVRLVIDLLQSFHAGMGVHLRRTERRVPQQLLHRPQIGAGIQHMGGKAVPQRMHPEAVTPHTIDHPVHDPLDAAWAEPLAPAAQEHRPAIGAPVAPDRIAQVKIAAQDQYRPGSNGDDALFSPFSPNLGLI